MAWALRKPSSPSNTSRTARRCRVSRVPTGPGVAALVASRVTAQLCHCAFMPPTLVCIDNQSHLVWDTEADGSVPPAGGTTSTRREAEHVPAAESEPAVVPTRSPGGGRAGLDPVRGGAQR